MKHNAILFSNHDNLLSLYDGIKVDADVGRELMTRNVLSPVLGDLLASRKVSQFLKFKTNKLYTQVKVGWEIGRASCRERV